MSTPLYLHPDLLPAQVNTVICVLATYPMGLVFRSVPGTTARHFLTAAMGLAMCFLCFREHAAQLVFMTVFTWLIIKYAGKSAPTISLVYCMSHLFAQQFYQRTYYWGDYGLDITGPLMILCQKMSQLAYSVHDANSDPEKLSKLQKQLVLKRQPTLLETFGYAFNFSSILLGPNYQYVEYQEQIEVNAAPSGAFPGVKKMLAAFLYIAVKEGAGGILGISTNPHDMFDPESEVSQRNMLGKYGHIMLSMMVYRCQFYFAWTLAEGACNCAGLGYKKPAKGGEKDAKDASVGTWDGVQNVDPIACETAQNLKAVLDNWNQKTQTWLVYVCYERTPKSINVYATMGLSAVWHGPYLGYLMTFMTAAFVTEAARKIRRTIRPYFLPEKDSAGNTPPLKMFYDVLTWFVTLSVLNYMVGPFVMLEAQKSHEYFNTFYYVPHAIIIGTFLVLPGKKKAPKKEGEAAKKGQ